MATIGAQVFKHHKKADGTYNVKIRIFHKGERKYIDTQHYVSKRQLTIGLKIKDRIINKQLNIILDSYRETISGLGERLQLFSAEALKEYLTDKDEDIDFLKFCSKHIEVLENNGKGSSGKTLNTVRLSLIDYFNRDSISPLDINQVMLIKYEKYLRSDREISRLNQGIDRKRKVKALGDAGVHNRLRDLRILYKAAMKFYNNPQTGDVRIPVCPFDNYKIIEAPETRKRNLTVDQIAKIRDCVVEPGGRAELARDLFMLSFYLCGMNAVDLYYLSEQNIVNGRVEYNRAKTEERRRDNAFISIKLIKEAEEILNSYLGKLHERYLSSENLDRAINEGMKILCNRLGFEGVTFYWARHSFGNLARNKARMSKDDVAQALNHIDNNHRTTDIYIEKDWVIVDDVQAAVLRLLFRFGVMVESVTVKEIFVRNILGGFTLPPLI